MCREAPVTGLTGTVPPGIEDSPSERSNTEGRVVGAMPSRRRAYLTLTPEEDERVRVLVTDRGLPRPSAVRTAVQEGAPRAPTPVPPPNLGAPPEYVRRLTEDRDSWMRKADELARKRDEWRSHALALREQKDAWVLHARALSGTRRSRRR